MKAVFADTSYWIALANPRDQWHGAAKAAGKQLGTVELVTTDEVLGEFLNFFGGLGQAGRNAAVTLVRMVMNNPNVAIVPQSRDTFMAGFVLYERRGDKEYSLTDCISMALMKKQSMIDVLTHDEHFRQEGLNILLTDRNTDSGN